MVNIKNNVLIGHSGWLYLYGGTHNQFEYLLKEKSPSQQSIDNFTRNIERRSSYCKTKEIEYCHVVFPSKPIACSEFLPTELSDVTSLFLSEYSNSGVIYPIDSLKKSDCFFKTDTHLHGKGSWLVLEEILTILGVLYVDIKPEFIKFPKLGDLTVMLSDDSREMSWALSGTNRYSKIFRTNNLKSLKGNSGGVFIYKNPMAYNNKRLLVFGDSFFALMMDHLSIIFSDVIFVRTSNFYSDLIELYSPDVVISGNAERYLSNVALDCLNSSFLLKYLEHDFYDSSCQDKSFFNALNAQLSFTSKRKTYTDWSENIDSVVMKDLAVDIEKQDPHMALELMKKSLELNPHSIAAKNMINKYSNYF